MTSSPNISVPATSQISTCSKAGSGVLKAMWRTGLRRFSRASPDPRAIPHGAAAASCASHKKKFENWLSGELAESGIDNPAAIARQIVVLLDGVFSTLLVHRDADYAEAAGQAARTLIHSSYPTKNRAA